MPSAKPHPHTKDRLAAKPEEALSAGLAEWRLPSGKALGEFALQGGFVAPLLLEGLPFRGEAEGSGGAARGRVHGSGWWR